MNVRSNVGSIVRRLGLNFWNMSSPRKPASMDAKREDLSPALDNFSLPYIQATT